MDTSPVPSQTLKKKILFVDDESNVLDGLQRMLRNRRNEWEMRFSSSAIEALKLLEQEPFNVVVSDMRMPGMDGRQFFTIVMQKYPDVVRIILSGQSDRDILIKSIDLAHQFLSKPCDSDTLKSAIEGACGLKDVLKNENLRRLISRIDVLPSLPIPYLQLLEELRSPKASVDRVGRIIAQDFGMTAKILHLANSAFFGLRQRVSSPAHAASMLGLETIKALVLTVQVFKQFDSSHMTTFSVEDLWTHCVTTGGFAQAIAKAEGQTDSFANSALMAGMLHDIGKLVLADQFSREWEQVARDIAENNATPCDAERAAFGATHAELGAFLLGLWGLDYSITETLAYHHIPGKCSVQAFGTLACVHVGNVIEHELSESKERSHNLIDTEYLDRIHLGHRLTAWTDLCRVFKQDIAIWMRRYS